MTDTLEATPWLPELKWGNAVTPGVLTKEQAAMALGIDTQLVTRMSPTAGSYTISIGQGDGMVSAADYSAAGDLLKEYEYYQPKVLVSHPAPQPPAPAPVKQTPAKIVPGKTASPYSKAADAVQAEFFRVDSYMEEVHNPALLLEIYKEVVDHRLKIDTLVGRGVSGTLAVSQLARDLGLKYFIIRKDTESSHSYYPFEGTLGRNWLFVDDLISSGKTFAEAWYAVDRVRTKYKFTSKFKGVLLYNDHRFIQNDSPTIKNYLQAHEPEEEKAW